MISYQEIRIDSNLSSGDKVSIALVSDLHVDSNKFSVGSFKEKLEGVDYMMIFGDVADWIFYNDKRFIPSNNAIQTGDAFITDSIKYVSDLLLSLGPTIIFMGYGNHEMAVLKAHGVDPVVHIAEKIGCKTGGYTGTVNLVFGVAGKRVASLKLGYHHGRWGGFNDKGFSGAKRYFDAWEGYDVFVYGHNHASRCDVVKRISISGSKHIPRDILFVNCSSQVTPLHGGGVASYDVVSGYEIQPNVVNVLHLRAKCSHGIWSFKKSLEIRVG